MLSGMDSSVPSSPNNKPASAPTDNQSAMPSTSSIAVSDPHAKYPSLQFSQDEVHVKPWDPNNTELVEMAKNLTPIQIAWIASREHAIETLLWTKFTNKLEERGLFEDWADNAVIPQFMDSYTIPEQDAAQIEWLKAKAPDLLDEYLEHRKGQRARREIRERPGWVPS